jgi:aminoglycoside phosphotransferase (APT) family kinase protein
VRAVLDWELSTLGDPLADLGFTLAHWHPDGGPILGGLQRLTLPDGGFLTRDEMVETYSVASGRDVSSIDFYLVLACFKTAVIFEGIHARHLARDTVGRGFDTAATSVDLFTHQALEVSAGSSVPHLKG